ncbi:hypothetical protein Ae201684P_017008 [Aphanomyces euteiches]|uniref:Myb/SANT-like domain-containing protein n=1 Tax=Aphanomyces euteiches TaxID=100861 RepID=A0A6G0WMN2_9STRA|nr:hypothetical protein Ae201684_013534 [Aphanomyces euteiches]KAH9094400.1 hypothetical protein Ae201684P_017008 [Aphanomyces euteiches]
MSKRPAEGSDDRKQRVGRPRKEDEQKEAVRWSERSVECMFELRYKTLADRFDRCKNTQATKEAYITLACELSLQMVTPFDASQVQNKLHDLRKKWTSPKHKATGNGDLVKTKPQYYDILNDYWGSKEGLSRTSLLSTDVVALETNDDNPDRACDEQNVLERPNDDIVMSSQYFSRKPAQSRKMTSSALSQVDALLSDLKAVGSGLEAIGASIKSGSSGQSDQTAALASAMERQSAAFEAQALQLKEQSMQTKELIQILLARESRES